MSPRVPAADGSHGCWRSQRRGLGRRSGKDEVTTMLLSQPLLSASVLLLLLLITMVPMAAGGKHVNVVLVGATGDLAKKYLWQGFFRLYQTQSHHGYKFSFYGCGRRTIDVAGPLMETILKKSLRCEHGGCVKQRDEFISSVVYHQLKTEEHFSELRERITQRMVELYGSQSAADNAEAGRLVYLSTPPAAYADATHNVNEYLRPSSGATWLRVVIEKPFGHDKQSAVELSEQLSRHLEEQEMYRIDHYLGKSVAKQILPFRYDNRGKYEELWNRQHVEQVEIMMKERVDVKGRVSFYNEYGIIRDVVQNHLTELMLLIAMDLPTNIEDTASIQLKKLQVLEAIKPVPLKNILIGQYESYLKEAKAELKDWDEAASVPTYATALLHVDNPRWKGVPFILSSGKKLNEKTSYLKVTFKSVDFCEKDGGLDCDLPRQIVFQISSESLHIPAILVSKSLPQPNPITGWDMMEPHSALFAYDQKASDFYVYSPMEDVDAYTALIEGVFKGDRHLFVGTKHLLALWDVWTSVLSMLKEHKPVIYRGGDTDWLSYRLLQNGQLQVVHVGRITENIMLQQEQQKGTTFRGSPLVSGKMDDIVSHLAENITNTAFSAIRERGVFHLALSGGNTPVPLLRQLINQDDPKFPWQETHVWLVDERCLPLTHNSSNFQMVNREVLEHVHIPYLNIHPMPVHLLGLCDQSEKGDQIYQAEITRLVTGQAFDYVLLGVGEDGHTASLFPWQQALDEGQKLITIAKGGSVDTSVDRMTMSFNLLNKARSIGILMTGRKKNVIVKKIEKSTKDPKRYPVTGIEPIHGRLTWYIDSAALYGL